MKNQWTLRKITASEGDEIFRNQIPWYSMGRNSNWNEKKMVYMLPNYNASISGRHWKKKYKEINDEIIKLGIKNLPGNI